MVVVKTLSESAVYFDNGDILWCPHKVGQAVFDALMERNDA